MMGWTDRHCRHFHRRITSRARLYTEMIATGALRHGDVPRHLDFDPIERPLALQVGGSDPGDLAHAAKLAERWGYDEINLNCGCPSERVQQGAFGACLMAEPALVRDGVRAMNDALGGRLPVTVKHRIGLGRDESYAFVRDFVGTVAEGGCRVFIVHARNAWLEGLSPKENRDIPPLRYEIVRRLARDFADLTIVVNGGMRTNAQIAAQLETLGGVMVGREAYHRPALMAEWDRRFCGPSAPDGAAQVDPGDDWRRELEAAMVAYMQRQPVPWPQIARHMLGLWNGRPGARRWRQVWSDHRLADRSPGEVAKLANAARARQLAASG